MQTTVHRDGERGRLLSTETEGMGDCQALRGEARELLFSVYALGICLWERTMLWRELEVVVAQRGR